jgi:hypothetical protein
MKQIVLIILLFCLATPVKAADTAREQIGEVLGKPVYRDQILKTHDLYSQLQRLFRMPVQQKELVQHSKELTPRDWEIEYVADYLKKKNEEDLKQKDSELNNRMALTRKELDKVEKKLAGKDLPAGERAKLEKEKEYWQAMLKPTGQDSAKIMLSEWKYYRYLYDNFGGGRVIWSRKNLLPFDASLKWLKQHEEKGDFKITDPKLHEAFYSYWQENEKSPFFLDELRVQSEFVHPPWEPVKKDDVK